MSNTLARTPECLSSDGRIFDAESVRAALVDCVETGVGFADEATNLDALERIAHQVGRVRTIKENPRRGSQLSSRPIILDPQGLLERLTTHSTGPLAEAGAELSENVDSYAASEDVPELMEWSPNRASINRFHGTPDEPGIILGHRDQASVGNIIPILSVHEGSFWCDRPDRARTVARGTLTFLIGSGMEGLGNYPRQPFHGARADHHRESVAFIDVQTKMTAKRLATRLFRR